MKEMGYGQEYRYAHDEANAYAAGEVYFPPEIAQTRYYFPTNRGLEGKIGEKLAWLAEQDQNSPINATVNVIVAVMLLLYPCGRRLWPHLPFNSISTG